MRTVVRHKLVRDMFWYPTKPEIQDSVEFKKLEFAQEESEGSWMNPKEWLDRYIYTDIHDIFFCEFPLEEISTQNGPPKEN